MRAPEIERDSDQFGLQCDFCQKIDVDSSFREMNAALGKMFSIGDGSKKEKN